MATTIERDPLRELDGLLRAGRWADACAYYERGLTGEERARKHLCLPYAIALIRLGRERPGLALLDPALLDLPDARLNIRRHLVAPLVEEKRFELALELLDRLLAARPDQPDDLRLRGSLLGRLKRWPEAIRDAAALAQTAPEDLPAQTSYLQLLLQSGQVEEAGEHAAGLVDRLEDFPRLANVALLALVRSGRTDLAADAAAELAESELIDALVAVAIVRTLFDTGQLERAMETAERLLDEGLDDPALRSFCGQAYMSSQVPDRYERAIAHFAVGLESTPDDVRMNALMGEALLRTRSYDKAIPYLEKACRQQPRVPQAKALYARALKQAGRYAEAAAEFGSLIKMQPASSRWRRYAAGALSQAGRRAEAVKLFDAFVAERRRTMPKRFEQGLEELWGRVGEADIPQARLDWAWTLGNGGFNDRSEWERRARWGHLADHYLLDWLECRDDRVHEAMSRLADLSEPERVLSQVDRRNGLILASAHIGPMYAGPLALELLGIRSRWLASTPSAARTSYAESLISTSDQDDRQVARAFMASLKQGYAVVLAVDGAINLAAPRIPFEGQEMTYSSFAARTAHRMRVPSLFCAPKWEGDRIGFVLERLPDSLPDESADDHAERWKAAYLTALRVYLGGAPENLRLSGGLWRHIR